MAAGVPVFLKGTGGPRAPHVFEMDRRGNLGLLVFKLESNLLVCNELFLNVPLLFLELL